MLCGLWVLSAETNYGELKLVSILVRDAILFRPRMNCPHPGGRAWGGNWMIICMGAIHPISKKFRTTISCVFLKSAVLLPIWNVTQFPSQTAQCREVLWAQSKRQSHSTSVSFETSSKLRSFPMCRMAPGCPQFGSLLSPQYCSDYGELKPVSILIRDAVLLGQE